MPMHTGHVRIRGHGHGQGPDRADQGLPPIPLARASAALPKDIGTLSVGITALRPEEGEEEVQATLSIRALAIVVAAAAERGSERVDDRTHRPIFK